VIVRILGEGQYELDESTRASLEALDEPLENALQSGDDAGFATALVAVEEWVRDHGTQLDPTTIVPSDLVLPAPGSELSEVRSLLESESEGRSK
jgi:hypothetical protein